MHVPSSKTFRRPALEALSDGETTGIQEIYKRVADAQGLTREQRQVRDRSDEEPLFNQRIRTAVCYQEKAGLIERVRRGVFRLREKGRQELGPSFRESEELRKVPGVIPPGGSDRPRPEVLQAGLLGQVCAAEPKLLQRVAADLLTAMGYVVAAMGQVPGRPGDDEIRGTIQTDELGLNKAFFQMGRHAGDKAVGEDALQRFAGAMDAEGTNQGVLGIIYLSNQGIQCRVDRPA